MISKSEAICKITKKYDIKNIWIDEDRIIVIEGSDDLYAYKIAKLLEIPDERVDYGATLNEIIIDLSPIKKSNFMEIMNKLNARFSQSSNLIELKRDEESIIVRVIRGCGIHTGTLRAWLKDYDCNVDEIDKFGEYYSMKITPKSEFNLLTASENEIKSKLSDIDVVKYIETSNKNKTIVIGFERGIWITKVKKALGLPDKVGVCVYSTPYGSMLVINKLQLEKLCE